jgi:hypothetical protein
VGKARRIRFWEGRDMPYHDLMPSIFELPADEEKRELLEDLAEARGELDDHTGAAEGTVSEEE